MSKPVIISRQTIESKLADLGVDFSKCQVGIAAAEYSLPSKAWIAGQFAQDWTEFRSQIYAGFEEGTQVCQHYSQGASWYAQILNRDTPGRPVGCPLLLAEMWYVRPTLGGHGINFSMVYEGDELEPVFFEPQLSTIITLQRSDINTCEFIRA